MKINLEQLMKRNHQGRKVDVTVNQKAQEEAGEFLVQHGYQRINESVFDSLVQMMAGLKLGTVAKGFCWMGGLGVGKSFGAEFLSAYCGIDFVGAHQLTDAFSTDPKERANFELLAYPCRLGNPNAPKDLIIDELGREPIPVNFYGTTVNVLEMVLKQRYILWERFGARTIITTNCIMKGSKKNKGIRELYGDYIESRIEQMCNLVPANGRDLRKA